MSSSTAFLETVLRLELSGIVATNTTVERAGSLQRYNQAGGVSGRPLHGRSIELIKYISRSTNRKLTIVGVGGILDADTAAATLDAGATLIQLYTGLVYGGPFLAKEIVAELRSGKGFLKLVLRRGLEPLHLSAYAPQAYVSTNSTT